jgi:hypothetical protein
MDRLIRLQNIKWFYFDSHKFLSLCCVFMAIPGLFIPYVKNFWLLAVCHLFLVNLIIKIGFWSRIYRFECQYINTIYMGEK